MNPAFEACLKSYSQLRSDMRTASGMLSLVAGLRSFLREPVTLDKAKVEIKEAILQP